MILVIAGDARLRNDVFLNNGFQGARDANSKIR
jgi:hypothetical protein